MSNPSGDDFDNLDGHDNIHFFELGKTFDGFLKSLKVNESYLANDNPILVLDLHLTRACSGVLTRSSIFVAPISSSSKSYEKMQ